MLEDVDVKKADNPRLFKELVERQRISDDLRYDNMLAFIEIRESTIEDLKNRVKQLDVKVKVNPLKKFLKHYNLFM